MKRIYEVKYEYKYEGIGGWSANTVNILANGDARIAVKRAEQREKKDKKVKAFRLVQVRVLAEAR